MRKKTLTLFSLLVALLALCVAAAPALAEENGYTYTVRIFGGNHGTFADGSNIYVVPRQFAYGDEIRLSDYAAPDSITVDQPNKYYVKGFRLSGADGPLVNAFSVTEDTDIVVAYGVRGEMVSYTVNFVEYGSGNPVTSDSGSTSVTFTGKKGDKAMVPYEYVTGYRPRYRNVTGTLGEDGSNNWTLEYIPQSDDEVVVEKVIVTETSTSTATTTSSTSVRPATPSSSESTPAAATPSSSTASSSGGSNSSATSDTTSPVTATPLPATEEVLDVDNPSSASSTQDSTTTNATTHEATASNVAPSDSTIPAAKTASVEQPTNQRGSSLGILSNPAALVSTAGVLTGALCLALFFIRKNTGNDGGEEL